MKTRLEQKFDKKRVKLTKIVKTVVEEGISGEREHELRSLLWLISTGVVSKNRAEWESCQVGCFEAYTSRVRQFAPGPNQSLDERWEARGRDLSTAVDPYSGVVGAPPTEQQAAMLKLIEKDVLRTQLDESPCFDVHLRQDVAMYRILYLCGLENDGVGYVQGMSHMCRVAFHVFHAGEEINLQQAEAQTWAFLTAFVRAHRQWLISSFDHQPGGLYEAFGRVSSHVHRLNAPLDAHLRQEGVGGEFYLFRWVMLLCCMELPLAMVIPLWDIFLLDAPLASLEILCASMVVLLDDRLKDSDMGECLTVLQNFPQDRLDAVVPAFRANLKRLGWKPHPKQLPLAEWATPPPL